MQSPEGEKAEVICLLENVGAASVQRYVKGTVPITKALMKWNVVGMMDIWKSVRYIKHGVCGLGGFM